MFAGRKETRMNRKEKKKPAPTNSPITRLVIELEDGSQLAIHREGSRRYEVRKHGPYNWQQYDSEEYDAILGEFEHCQLNTKLQSLFSRLVPRI